MRHVIFGENLEVLKRIPSGSVRLIYIDPPFNTGKVQSRKHLKTERDENGDRISNTKTDGYYSAHRSRIIETGRSGTRFFCGNIKNPEGLVLC